MSDPALCHTGRGWGKGGWWLREILKEDPVGDFQSGQLVSAEVGEGGDYSSRAVAAETRVL